LLATGCGEANVNGAQQGAHSAGLLGCTAQKAPRVAQRWSEAVQTKALYAAVKDQG